MDSAKFKILSIDGGGMRGIIPAKVLCELEEELQNRNGKDARLCDYFDLICGTSTGGIIAIGLALGMSAKELLGFYCEHGKDIFTKFTIGQLKNHCLYNRTALKKYLTDAYGETKINDCKTRICIPTYDLYNGTIHIIKTPHLVEYVRDLHIPTVDAALCTAAAPVYFEPYSFKYKLIDSSIENQAYFHIDGGVFANNPALIGLIEATKCLLINLNDVALLSIGTGQTLLKQTDFNRRMGFLYWLWPKSKESLRIYELASSAQAINIDNTLSLIYKGAGNSDEKRFSYIRLQEPLQKDIKLDAVDDDSINALSVIGQELYKHNATKLYPFIETKIKPYR